MANAASARETIARLTIELGADGSKLAPELASAMAKAKSELAKANRDMERAQATAFKSIQGHINSINAAKPTHEMRMLEQAVLKLGGTANLTRDQLSRVTVEVNRLAAAGAKVPAALNGLTGIGSKLGAAFQVLGTGGGISGALASIGPAGLAASAGLGAVTLAGSKAFGAIKELAGAAEDWTNTARSTGLGVVEVQQLSALLEDAGIPAEALSKAMKELQKEIATGGKELAKFGINVADLKDLSPEEQFRSMAERIAAIEDPADRTAVALAAFGRSGTDLIPVLGDVAESADKMFDALGEGSVQSLVEADRKIDAFERKISSAWKRMLAGAIEFAQGVSFGPGGIPIFTGNISGAIDAAASGPKPPSAAAQAREAERQKIVAEAKAAADRKQAAEDAKKAAAEEKRAADERFRAVQKASQAEAELIKAREQEIAAIQKTAEKLAEQSFAAEDRAKTPAFGALGSPKAADQALFERSIKNAQKLFGDLTKAGVPAEKALAQVKTRLEGVGLSGQDLEAVMRSLPSSIDQTAAATSKWEGVLAGLSTGFALLGGALGGLWDRVLGTINNIKGSFSGWKGKTGGQKFEAVAGAAGQLGGVVGGQWGGALSGAAGGAMTGAAIGSIIPGIGTVAGGVIGGVIGAVGGFLKGRQAKKDAKEAGKILGRSVSEEAAKQLKQEAKAAGMSFADYVKKIAADEARQKAVEKRQALEAGLGTARGGAEGLMARLEKGGLSDGLRRAFETLIGKVGEALLKNGLGILDARLQKSEKFTEAQGAAADVAQVVAGMRDAGLIDAGLTAAAGESAVAIQQEATAAAIEAGMSQAEATRAGFAAIAPILQQQLNASIQSGQDLDENTRRLLEEAKANGIEILADPALQQLDVSKQQLGVLQEIAGQGGREVTIRLPGGDRAVHVDGEAREPDAQAARGFGPMITPNLGRGLGPLIQTHPGELAMVIPRSRIGRDGLISAASGLGTFRAAGARGTSSTGGAPGSQVIVNLTIAENPFQSAEGLARLRDHTLETVEREVSKNLAALVASGRA